MRLTTVRAGTVATATASLGLLLTVGAAVGFGYELALLTLSSSVLLLVIVLFWSSVRNLAGDTPITLDEALSFGAPSAAEEQKRAVLRALKDLEFERSVGKISEQDYLDFSARYRAEARKLITAADESSAPAHDLAQKLAAERLAQAGLAPAGSKAKDSPSSAAETAPESGAQAPAIASAEIEDGTPELADEHGPAVPDVRTNGAPATTATAGATATTSATKIRSCPECDTKNDLDARFCKSCGAALAASERADMTSSEEAAEEKLS